MELKNFPNPYLRTEAKNYQPISGKDTHRKSFLEEGANENIRPSSLKIAEGVRDR